MLITFFFNENNIFSPVYHWRRNENQNASKILNPHPLLGDILYLLTVLISASILFYQNRMDYSGTILACTSHPKWWNTIYSSTFVSCYAMWGGSHIVLFSPLLSYRATPHPFCENEHFMRNESDMWGMDYNFRHCTNHWPRFESEGNCRFFVLLTNWKLPLHCFLNKSMFLCCNRCGLALVIFWQWWITMKSTNKYPSTTMIDHQWLEIGSSKWCCFSSTSPETCIN